MSLVHRAIALGLLTASGCVSGFLLTNGSGKYLGMVPAQRPHSRAPHANEQAASAMLAASGGEAQEGAHGSATEGGGGAETAEATEQAGGGAEGEAATAASGGGADAATNGRSAGSVGADAAATRTPADAGAPGSAAAGAGAAASASGAPSDGTRYRVLKGVDAAAFLAGNTVVEDATPGREWFSYFTPREAAGDGRAGTDLRIVGDRKAFAVRLWDPRNPKLCEPGDDGVLQCRTIEIRAEIATERISGPGVEIGEIRKAGEHWSPVLRGNVKAFPTHVAGLDGRLTETTSSRKAAKATASGATAWAALLDRPTALAGGDRPGSRRVLVFARDGRSYEFERTEEAIDGVSGVEVKAGSWTFAGDRLCRDPGVTPPGATCYTVEAWGPSAFRLVQEGGRGGPQLTVLTVAKPSSRRPDAPAASLGILSDASLRSLPDASGPTD